VIPSECTRGRRISRRKVRVPCMPMTRRSSFRGKAVHRRAGRSAGFGDQLCRGGGVPFIAAEHPPDLAPVRIVEDRGRQVRLIGDAERGLGVEIGFQRRERLLREERRDLLGTLKVLADRDDLDLVLQAARDRIERWHLGDAGRAPGRPQVEQQRLALEAGERDGLSIGGGEA